MGPPIVSDFVFNLFCLRSRKLLNSALTDLVKIDCMDNVKPSVSKNIKWLYPFEISLTFITCLCPKSLFILQILSGGEF